MFEQEVISIRKGKVRWFIADVGEGVHMWS